MARGPQVRTYPLGEQQAQGVAAPFQQATGGEFGQTQAAELRFAAQELERAATSAGNIGLAIQNDLNEARVQELNNEFIDTQMKVLNSGPDAFFRKRGSDAINGAEAATSRLVELKKDMLARDNVSPLARRRLGEVLDAQINGAVRDINRHVGVQATEWEAAVAAGRAELINNKASMTNDLAELAGLAMAAEDMARAQAKALGRSGTPWEEALIVKSQSDVYTNNITARIIANDPSAIPLFERVKHKLDARDRLGLEKSIETLQLGVDARGWVASNTTVPTSGGAAQGVKTSMGHWTGAGYSAPVAAGITAGFLRESQFHTGAVNPRDGRDGSNSINIGQWNAERAKAFQSFAAANGLNPGDINTGLAYAKAEIDGVIPYSVSGLKPDFKQRLQNAKSEKEAADLMTREYFRPKYTEGESRIRQGSASAILAQHGGGGPAVAQGGGEQPRSTDPLQIAVDAATGVPAPQPGSSDGIVDARRQMIAIEQQKVDLTARNLAENGGNPPLMQRVQGVIDAQFSQGKARVQLYKDQLYASVQDWMARGGPNGGPAVTLPPANILSQMTWEQQQSLERQVARNIEGKKTVTNWDAWYNIHAGLTSGNANERETWASTPLMQFREYLADDELKELAKLQAAVRRGDDKHLTSVQTPLAQVNAALTAMGIDPTPKPKDKDTKAANFHRMFQNELTIFEEAKGKAASEKEIQGIVDGLVKKVAGTGGWLSGDRSVFQLEAKDIPEADRLQIISAIRKAGGVPTDERVLEVYRHKLVTAPRETEIPRPLEPAMTGMPQPLDPPPGPPPWSSSTPRAAVSRPEPARPRTISNPDAPTSLKLPPRIRLSPPDELRKGLGLE